MLECDVTAWFGAFPVCAQLTVPAGVTALVGPSGAGKSSLLRLIAGLSRPDTGRITLDGRALFDGARAIMVPPEGRRIGMVFQRPALVPHFSVRGNIQLGARGKPIPRELLERTGCARLLDRPLAALSGGEQQRVMLARALAGGPRLLLLDEPLSALDPQSRDTLLQLLAELSPVLGIPVVYVTHAMEEAGRVATRFALMREGRVAATGTAAEVLSQAGAGEGGVGGILRGRVVEVAEDGLATIDVAGRTVETPGAALQAGDPVALRVWARDVVLARAAPTAISARNALEGHIAGLRTLPGGQVEVRVAVGQSAIPALVMARTVQEMGLAEGQAIVAVFKSASVERIVE